MIGNTQKNGDRIFVRSLFLTKKERILKPDDFFSWMVQAQNAYKQARPDIEIGPDGQIDLSEIK